jgi:hypothetical protein
VLERNCGENEMTTISVYRGVTTVLVSLAYSITLLGAVAVSCAGDNVTCRVGVTVPRTCAVIVILGVVFGVAVIVSAAYFRIINIAAARGMSVSSVTVSVGLAVVMALPFVGLSLFALGSALARNSWLLWALFASSLVAGVACKLVDEGVEHTH